VRNNAFSWIQRISSGVLLAAAALKAHELLAGHREPDALLTSRWLLTGVVEAQLLLALWLLSGLYARAAWWAAVGCFSVFAAVAGLEGVLGRASCGCFGMAAINPWYTFAFDCVAVAALARWRPTAADRLPRQVERRRLVWVGACGVLAAGVMIAAAARSQPAASEEGLVSASGLVILEPEKWVGREFPLMRYIEADRTARTEPRPPEYREREKTATQASPLQSGNWTVVLYHWDCPHCREALPQYEALAREDHGRVARATVLIEMPPYAPAGEELVSASSACVLGKLSDEREWFATTPLVVAIQDGKVVSVQQGEAAAHPKP
jgi:hypothetical protein